MARKKYINIDFPFVDSKEGFYFNLTQTDQIDIMADLLHLLLTNKCERLYMPDFGSDLKKYIFEPNDSITHSEIKDNLNETIKRYLPNLVIDSIEFKNNEIEELIIVEVRYTVIEVTFTSSDVIEVTF